MASGTFKSRQHSVVYQPQVDDWKNFRELDWRMAFSLTPAGGQEVVGVATLTRIRTSKTTTSWCRLRT